jgi:hypothetical protein
VTGHERHQVRWVGKDAGPLPAVAAALSTIPEYVMAVRETPDGRYGVLWTPGYPDDQTVWAAELRRDGDQLVVVHREPRPGAWEELERILGEEEEP